MGDFIKYRSTCKTRERRLFSVQVCVLFLSSLVFAAATGAARTVLAVETRRMWRETTEHTEAACGGTRETRKGSISFSVYSVCCEAASRVFCGLRQGKNIDLGERGERE